ncbi:unnamed protein product [Dovyalis caffra]|uniref:Uncharacterized protein n=1 Tax=Dovyalis caffra TaxID=77055 RepID=A0AAV1S158_9ROSI|nr:unnamed protein product [Dovyalis caffra]
MAETHILVPENEWLRSIISDEQGVTISQLPRPTIPRVPLIFSGIDQSNKKCYEPLLVSIGPYHHGKLPDYQEMENSKVTMARQFVQQSGKHIEDIYKKVVDLAEQARRCYAEDESFKLDEFTRMMFLDGCFLIQFMHCLLDDHESLKMTSHAAAMVTRDVLLLENQLPFLFLKSLMNLRFGNDEKGMKLIKDFIKHIRAMPRQRDSCRKKISKFFSKTIKRLLASNTNPKGVTVEEYSDAGHLLELFHMHFVGRNVPIECSRTSVYRYHPAMDLRRVGIHFKPSKTNQFTDVHFKPTWLAGRLQIPPLTIDDSTKSLLLNLVAYEACTSNQALWVTSYICFMDSLIDHPEDVRELRLQGILLITLGSEQEVAKLFNEIANYLVPNPYAFNKVKKGIESHYRNTFKRWILHYKGPIYTVIFKYSFIFGLIISALKYVKVFPTEPLYGVCRVPATNVTLYP